MKAKIFLSCQVMKRLELVRVQLFNTKIYRLTEGTAILQIPYYEDGNLKYQEFGKPLKMELLFNQIKLVFDTQNKVVAVRTTKGEPLQALPMSIWAKNKGKKSITK